MKQLKILIVEDEVLISEMLKIFLEERGYVATGLCISYEEAVDSYKLIKPDIALIDLRLYGEKSGIDFGKFLQEQRIKTPFIYLTSQYDDRILKLALETCPLGYLTKPVQKESLWTTLESSYNLFINTQSGVSITITDGANNHKIIPQDVLYLKSDHVYCKVMFKDNHELIIRSTLANLACLFQEFNFIQVHRSFVINVDNVYSWNNSEVFFKNTKVPISRSYKEDFLTFVSKV